MACDGAGVKPVSSNFLLISARFYTAPICCIGKLLCCQIYDELHVALDDIVGVSFGTHGNVTHGRVRANGSRPRYGKDVVFIRRGATRYQKGWKRVYHSTRLPVNFVLHELYEFDRVQLLLFFAILALYDAVFAVRYMEVCGHRLVVGNALWISTFNDSDNFLWQGDTFLFNNLVVAYNT